jgi:hypothetical protein
MPSALGGGVYVGLLAETGAVSAKRNGHQRF